MASLSLLEHCEEIRYILLVSHVSHSGEQVADINQGEITLGNILEILPFQDAVVVIELDGERLWDAMESALSKFPAQEGFVIFWHNCSKVDIDISVASR